MNFHFLNVYSLPRIFSALDSWNHASEITFEPWWTYRDLAWDVVNPGVRDGAVLLNQYRPSRIAFRREHPRVVLTKLGLRIAEEELENQPRAFRRVRDTR